MRYGRDNDYSEGDLVGRLMMLLRAMAYCYIPSLKRQMTWRW